MNHRITLNSLFRYPVKGFSGERLHDAVLTEGSYFPCDRLFTIENGPTGFDPAHPAWIAKQKFLVLMTLPKLAELTSRFDEASQRFTLYHTGKVMASGDLSTEEGRATIEAFLADFLKNQTIGKPKILKAPDGFRFTDSRRGFVSIVNLATVRAIEREAGEPLDPLRFRANLYIDGLPAFAEHELCSKAFRIGTVTLYGLKRTERCMATAVNLQTAKRDVMIPALLQRTYGHADCGIYCSVQASGTLREGDALEILQGELLP